MNTIHLSIKEIDAKLLHFKEELDRSADLLRKTEYIVEHEKDEKSIALRRLN